MLLHRMYHFRL